MVLLLTVAYDRVAGNAGDTAQRLGDPVAVQASAGLENGGPSPGRLADYRSLHRSLDPYLPLQSMTAAFSCPE